MFPRSPRTTALLALLLLAAPASAQRLHVPGDHATIQAAIDAAATGDTVLVAPGTYVENLDFKGKAIVVASRFAVERDPALIAATVIDGSQSARPDTASVVLFINGEGPDSVLEGFTITGGTGTTWVDEHGAGTYVEGGGVLIAFASPTIRYNRIVGNTAIRRCSSCTSAGGGAIRVGDGAPLIANNLITGNEGMYGAGVVVNYAAATLRNNVIVHNRVYQAVPSTFTFGGGGVWISGEGPGDVTLENNTIVGNVVEPGGGGIGNPFGGKGGGVILGGTTVLMRNNIIWGNTQASGGPVAILSFPETELVAAYNDVEGGLAAGEHTLDADPAFADDVFTLGPASPAVDAGDPDAAYADPEDLASPGHAGAPARGTVRNDLGAYGGPGASVVLPAYVVADEPGAAPPSSLGAASPFPNPFRTATAVHVTLPEAGDVTLRVFDVRGREVWSRTQPAPAGEQAIAWDARDGAGRSLAAGVYLFTLQQGAATWRGRMTLVQ